jgi:hypothetical protein
MPAKPMKEEAMAASKKNVKVEVPRMVRKTVTVDAAHLELVRKTMGLSSDAAVLRFALEHLAGHFTGQDEEE